MHVYLVPLIKVHLRLGSPLVALNSYFGGRGGEDFVIFSSAVISSQLTIINRVNKGNKFLLV